MKVQSEKEIFCMNPFEICRKNMKIFCDGSNIYLMTVKSPKHRHQSDVVKPGSGILCGLKYNVTERIFRRLMHIKKKE